MKLNRNTKFGEESTCHFKIDIKDLTSFDLSTRRKSQKFSFQWAPFEQSIYCFSLKSIEELSLMKRKRDTKFGEESTCCCKIRVRNLTNFNLSTQKSH